MSFIAQADPVHSLSPGEIGSDSLLIDPHSPRELQHLLNFSLPEKGRGKPGLMDVVDRLLRYSVNTWDQGFMHKLSGSTNAVGVVSELILAVLNANVSSHTFATMHRAG